MTCACPCGKKFEPKRSNQVYFNAEHRQKDSNRRWPVKRQSLLPVNLRKGHRERQEAGASYVTSHEGAQVAQRKLQALLVAGETFRVGRPRRKVLLTTREVADVLRVSAWTVKWWRVQQTGPSYVRLGGWAIRYPWAALVGYLQANLFEPASTLRGSRRLPRQQGVR